MAQCANAKLAGNILYNFVAVLTTWLCGYIILLMFSETRKPKWCAGDISDKMLAGMSIDRNTIRLLAKLAEANGDLPMEGLTQEQQANLTWRLAEGLQLIGNYSHALDGPDGCVAAWVQHCLAEDERYVLAAGGSDAAIDWNTIRSETNCLPAGVDPSLMAELVG